MNNAVYLDQIIKLIELQKVDDNIYKIKQKLENVPRQLEELDSSFSQAEGKRNHILDKLSHLQEQKKRLSVEIDDDFAKIKKSKNKLMQVGNSREYNAMIREMDSMEKLSRTREEEKITLLEELDTQNVAFEEIDKEYGEIKEQLETFKENLDEVTSRNMEELEKLSQKRTEVSENIPTPVFMRYEFIRERLDHPVIVEVKEGVCSGCHIAIPPQSYIELQKGKQILSCPNCQRLIFWDEHFEHPQHNNVSGNKSSELRENADN